MQTAVLVSPVFDDITAYSDDWSREAKSLLEQNSYEVIDISGRPVSRSEVEAALKANPDAIYVFFNHGSYRALWGSENEAVTDLSNVKLLSGRVTYTMACQSARDLGVEAWKNKAVAYYGYIEVFSFSTDALDEFKQFTNCGLRFYFESKSWKDAVAKARDLGKKLAQDLMNEGKLIASSAMSQDVDYLRCYDGETPTSRCILRRAAVKLFGPELGWKLRKMALNP